MSSYEIRALFAGFAIVCVVLFYSFGELRYMVSGRTVEATLITAKEERVSKREGSMSYRQLTVVYEFDDDGQVRAAADIVAPDWPIAKDATTIPVEFIPGTDKSRLKGNHHRGYLWGSGAILALAGVCGVAWWKFRDGK
jgi:hypothetical protein